MENILELEDITKEFPGVKALDGVTLEIRRGEIHAIVGENGAGKSTLMKIISGVYPKGTYGGTLRFDGEVRAFQTIRDSEDAGIAIIYQELALLKNMNIAENIFLGDELMSHGVIQLHETVRRAKGFLERVGLRVNPLTPVINLGIGRQQLVEIAKALSKRAKLLILDEPTAPLTETESENLLGIMRELRGQGVTCVFITHKLDEVFAVADWVTVLRDGRSVGTAPAKELTQDQVIARMVGRELKELFPRVEHQPGEPLLEVRDWTLTDPERRGRRLVDGVSFTLRRGEILGFSGLVGAGRTELAMSLFGEYRSYSKGEVYLEGRRIQIRRPLDAIRQGISYLSEDRKRYDPAAGENETWEIGKHIGCAVPTRDGRVLLTLQDGIYLYDLEKRTLLEVSDLEREISNNRLNDGKADSRGRLWFGSMSMTANQPERELEVTGSFYKLEPDGRIEKLFGGVGISNGLIWNADETVLYYVDSTTQCVFAFDFDREAGSISNCRTVARVAPDQGVPDGMTIDEEGKLWVAHFGGWKVSRIDPETGETLAEIPLPCAQVSCCCFGGEALDELYITTASIGLTAEEREAQPLAGCLFRVKPGVRGTRLNKF